MGIKIEKRGKYGGVKVHLDKEQCELLLSLEKALNSQSPGDEAAEAIIDQVQDLVEKIASKIRKLLIEEPTLLEDRSTEEVIAILAKEKEKAELQLARAKSGKDIAKVDPEELKKALLKHVKV